MSPDDVIELPGYPGEYARRALVDAWVSAGSPSSNSVTRLYAEQKKAWDAYQNGTGSPADNPDDPSQALVHVRGIGIDIDPTPDRVRRLSNAGLVRPYSYEPWHWQLQGDPRRFALITEFPSNTEPASTIGEDEMWRILNCPAYAAAGQVVLMRENSCETVPRGWIVNMILYGFVREVMYPSNDAMMEEVRNFYFMKSRDMGEASAETERVMRGVLDEYGNA